VIALLRQSYSPHPAQNSLENRESGKKEQEGTVVLYERSTVIDHPPAMVRHPSGSFLTQKPVAESTQGGIKGQSLPLKKHKGKGKYDRK
jgi:hypothetical protein